MEKRKKFAETLDQLQNTIQQFSEVVTKHVVDDLKKAADGSEPNTIHKYEHFFSSCVSALSLIENEETSGLRLAFEDCVNRLEKFDIKRDEAQESDKVVHKIKDCSPIVIELQKGTTSELNIVKNVITQVDSMDPEERKTLFNLKSTKTETGANPVVDDPVLIFDANGNPLTDNAGVPLINVSGHLVVKYKGDKPISHVNGGPIYDKFGLPFVSDFNLPLKTPSGAPLRLFNREKIPLTDESGVVMKLSSGFPSVIVDEHNRIISDVHGNPVYDSNGKPLNPEKNRSLDTFSTKERVNQKLYNEKGFLLTDDKGKPLLGANGEPLVKVGPTGEVTDLTGGPVYDEYGRLYGRKSVTPHLAIYSSSKYPLTNSKGDVLEDSSGKPLVVFDPSGKPISDSGNRVVFDSYGIPCTDQKFQPYVTRVKSGQVCLDINVQLYDLRGYPLLDYDGSSLLTSDGRPLIRTRAGKPVHDIEGNPIFDETGIPVTKLNGAWVCPHGEPYRVFDSQGRPLTDRQGRELTHVSGTSLLRMDQIGRPVFDPLKAHVSDSYSRPITDSLFDPSIPPPSDEVKMQVFVNGSPLKVYDKSGRPLTDFDGMGLHDSQGRCLILFNEAGIPISDINGHEIFDENRIPLNCNSTSPIMGMNGQPHRLFDTLKRPLTDVKGHPLSFANGRCLIKFDTVGRPMSDLTGGPLLDSCGRNIINDPEARPENQPVDDIDHTLKDNSGHPLEIYDLTGRPLTDTKGRVLVFADGSHIRLNHYGQPISDPNGSPLYDQYGTPIESVLTHEKVSEPTEMDAFGRPMKDSLGVPLFDDFGRPKWDLYRRPLYDDHGRPLATANARRISDGKPEPTYKLSFDPRILSGEMKNSKLKCAQESGLKDLVGGPLFDVTGAPLYNQYGKPLIDLYGRNLYDEKGHPLSDSKGNPVSTAVAKKAGDLDILNVKDVIKMIRVPNDMTNSIAETLSVGKRIESSHIIPGTWLAGLDDRHDGKHVPYWALVRITTLSDESKIFELLKAMDLDKSTRTKPCNCSESRWADLGGGDTTGDKTRVRKTTKIDDSCWLP